MSTQLIFRNPRVRYRAESFGGIMKVDDLTLLANGTAFRTFLSLTTPRDLSQFKMEIQDASILEEFVKNRIFVVIDKDDASRILLQEGKEVNI